MKTLLILAGLGQIGLALGSTVIPKLLKWQEETSKMNKLTGQVFWTYAVYILTINFSFGLLSVLLAGSLSDGSSLATAITGFIALYWISRLVIQFFYFDRSAAPTGLIYTLGEITLVLLFIFFSITYTLLTFQNIQA